MIKVLLADCHEIFRRGVKSIFQTTKINVVAEVESGEKALQKIKGNPVNVLIMGVYTPYSEELLIIERMTQKHPEVKILVLAARDDEILAERFIKNGAAGYLANDCNAEDLCKAVSMLANGENYISQYIAQKFAVKKLWHNIEDGSPTLQFKQLSAREMQVMLMITSSEKVSSIAKKMHLSTKTINTYRHRIFAKLGVKNNVELTHLAIRCGIIEQ